MPLSFVGIHVARVLLTFAAFCRAKKRREGIPYTEVRDVVWS